MLSVSRRSIVQSWAAFIGHLSSRGLEPQKIMGDTPNKAYKEKLYFEPKKIESIPKEYILCTQSDFKEITALAKKSISIEKDRWQYYELPTGHIPQATMPEELIKLFLELEK